MQGHARTCKDGSNRDATRGKIRRILDQVVGRRRLGTLAPHRLRAMSTDDLATCARVALLAQEKVLGEVGSVARTSARQRRR